MKLRGCIPALFVGLGSLPAPALAHHSVAMYDMAHRIEVTGVVEEAEWINPHVIVHLVAPGPNGGAPVRWSVESSSPGTMNRSGFSKRSFNPGDRVTLLVAPHRDGGPRGVFSTATLANGQTVTMSIGAVGR